ncbi:MAG TPA: hypothetical protein VHI13_13505 [Candidatus Kapabacteria bacterium]|nr:hypothetical protein [Candidatus Kapabacteria bacterium]
MAPSPPKWSAEEDTFLRKHYPGEGALYCATKLGRPKSGVNARAEKLGIRSLDTKPWTNKEDALLRLRYGKLTAPRLAAMLNRSETRVRHRIRKLGLNATGSAPWTSDDMAYLCAHYGTMTNAEIASELGRTVDAVELKAGRIGLSQRIVRLTPEQERYVAEHMETRACTDIARDLGIGVNAVMRATRKNGYRARPTSRAWTPDEDERLRGLFPVMRNREIAEQLERTELAVKLRCRLLGMFRGKGRHGTGRANKA